MSLAPKISKEQLRSSHNKNEYTLNYYLYIRVVVYQKFIFYLEQKVKISNLFLIFLYSLF